MNIENLTEVLNIEEGTDFEFLEAKLFEKMIAQRLSLVGDVRQQVVVNDRGDLRRGKIDLVFSAEGEQIPIEIDRRKPRKKSIFKVKSFNPINCFVITRSPFYIHAFGLKYIENKPKNTQNTTS